MINRPLLFLPKEILTLDRNETIALKQYTFSEDSSNKTSALTANCILQPKPPAPVPSQVLHHGALVKHIQIHRTMTERKLPLPAFDGPCKVG